MTMADETDQTPEAPERPEQPAEPERPEDSISPEARALINAANSEAAARRKELRETQEKLEAMARQNESDQERAVREAEERGAASKQQEIERLQAEHARELVLLSIRAKAAERFADPDDVVRLLGDTDEIVSVEDERARAVRITQALDQLAESKPYLLRQNGERPPLVSQGGRSDAPGTRTRERSWLRN